MVERPNTDEYAAYYEGYIRLVPEGNIIEMLEQQAHIVQNLLSSLTEEQANYRYAEGKWSVKEVIGHLLDNERIMSSRLLRIARGDQANHPGYDQDVLMQTHPFDSYTLADLSEEYAITRRSTILMIRRLTPEAWLCRGIVSDNPASARSIAFVMAGHELHHLSVLRDRYSLDLKL
ncbi:MULTISPECIES: DinB family protein [Paenibacillus]|uniref:DinB family protein n=1 Tax=Paenibacillus TaxID=44249 RepID=UPI001F3F043F|nr:MULTISPECIES: DinB family protein [Paenibacillus]MCF7754368.1 DinB family protein [Paenibacillus xylanexedens]MDQ0656297.1 putative damage-inducible protein DinB [Paenibacillus sp. W2I17]